MGPLPIGTPLDGVVASHQPSGFFVELPDYPEVRAVVELRNYRPGDRLPRYIDAHPLDPPFPSVGSAVTVEVVDWSRRQARLRYLSAPDD